MDVYSGMLWVTPIADKTKEQVASAFLSLLALLPVCPVSILLTDNGGEFSDTAAKRYCVQLSTADGGLFEMVTFARTLRTAVYMPNANGKLERIHQEISKLCRLHFLHPHQVLHILNTPAIRSLFFSSANNESARFRAHEALSDHDDDAAPDDAVKTWVAQRAAANPAPPPTEHDEPNLRYFDVGDSVLIKVPARQRAKADPTWKGPYQVMRKVGKTTYHVDNFLRGRGHRHGPFKHDIDHMKLYIPPSFSQYCFRLHFIRKIFETIPERVTRGSLPTLLVTPWTNEHVFVGLLASEWTTVLEYACTQAPTTLYGFTPTTQGIKSVQQALTADKLFPQYSPSVEITAIDQDALFGALHDYSGFPAPKPHADYLSFTCIKISFQAPPPPPAPAS